MTIISNVRPLDAKVGLHCVKSTDNCDGGVLFFLSLFVLFKLNNFIFFKKNLYSPRSKIMSLYLTFLRCLF